MSNHNKPSLRVLLVPFGSEGDVAPFLWLADHLAARGHRPVVAANPLFADLVKKQGHEFSPAGSADLLRKAMQDPRTWDGNRASKLLLHNLLDSLEGCAGPFLQPELAADLMVGTSFALAAYSAAEARGIPYVRLHLQPSALRSVKNLPVLGDRAGWLCKMPAPIIRGFFGLLDLGLDGAPLRKVNRFRAKLSLPPQKSFYREVCNSGSGLGGLFPSWFAPAQPDWPAGFQLFGFPMDENPGASALPPELESFLASGEKPVLWTHGSANFHTADFVREAERACALLRIRGVVVAPNADQLATPNVPGVLRLNYAPFDSLLPRCRAIVHHGGIGTLSKALRAGLPQLIIPRAFDQFDNAARAQRLGFGLAFRYQHLPRVAEPLRRLLNEPHYAEKARAFSGKLPEQVAIVPWLETIAAQPRSRQSEVAAPASAWAEAKS